MIAIYQLINIRFPIIELTLADCEKNMMRFMYRADVQKITCKFICFMKGMLKSSPGLILLGFGVLPKPAKDISCTEISFHVGS